MIPILILRQAQDEEFTSILTLSVSKGERVER
jgi:hypothetical protein